MTPPDLPYTATYELELGTFSLRRKMCRWIDEQPWNNEDMVWEYNICENKVILSVYSNKEKYLDVFYIKWCKYLKKLTQEENE